MEINEFEKRTPSAEEDDTGGAVVHLSQQEQRTIINALAEQRERQENALTQTEQLLRRMTGSITAYINEVGMRPLRMSDYDKAVLAVRDGGPSGCCWTEDDRIADG